MKMKSSITLLMWKNIESCLRGICIMMLYGNLGSAFLHAIADI